MLNRLNIMVKNSIDRACSHLMTKTKVQTPGRTEEEIEPLSPKNIQDRIRSAPT